MPLTAGTRLGSYEIVDLLGAGGMGEVYRARDPRLGREVAIKVLSDRLALDPDALARFEREATSVARLSHPNILSIFEFARDAGTVFVVMELVDGETLRAKLSGGPLPSRRAVAYALQIARGMAAAHARGIVHRDLKPENVMITRDDHVKILDFGLAKPFDSGDSEMTRGATVATSAGTVLGTFGYMAPEQVRGLAVDQRTDMFAFGAVLYEMLTGERAFKGETAADTMTAVLTKDAPDLDVARLSISPNLERIVRRCLEKTPDLRFQSANDLAFALDSLSTTSSGSTTSGVAPAMLPASPAPVAQSASRAWLPWSIAALAIVAASVLAVTRSRPVATDGQWNTFTRITDAAGEETTPSLSPDGNTLIYSARVGGNWNIYAQRVGGRNSTPIVGDPRRDERGPAFSPDGSMIAFHESDAEGGIFVAGATGESVRRVTDFGFDPAWSPDGKSIAFAAEEVNDPSSRKGPSLLYLVPSAGGTPKKIGDDEDGVEPSWSPSGDRLVYWSNTGGQRDICTISVTTGVRTKITNTPSIDWSPVFSPDGRYIYFSSDRGGAMNIWRVPVDAATGQVTGAFESVTTGVLALYGRPQFSRDGQRMVFQARVASVNPVMIPFDPATLKAGAPVILDGRNNIRVPSDVSPDSSMLSYFTIGERQEDILIGPVEGSMRRLTDDAARDRAPMFTADGKSLLFYSTRDGAWAIWSIGVDGGNLHKLTGAPAFSIYPVISPKGDTVALSGADDRAVYLLSLASPSAVAERMPGDHLGDLAFSPSNWSPDGARVVGTLAASGGRPSGIGVYDLAAKTLTSVSNDWTPWAIWLSDSRRVIYFTHDGHELAVLDTVTRTRTTVDVRLPAPSVDDTFAVSPDRRRIFYGAARSETDIWVVERK